MKRKTIILSFIMILSCASIVGCKDEANSTIVNEVEITASDNDIIQRDNSLTEKEESNTAVKKKEPTVGMRESEIENTELGKATEIEKCRDFDMLDDSHRWKKYIWDFGNGKKLVAKIYYDDGYGKVHDIDKYPKDPYGNTILSYWE